MQSYKQQWFGNPVRDIVAGAVVALALIPEAIAFSIIAGVDPQVGLYASFCMAVVIAFVGARPGMISAATGAMALLMVTLVKEHGLEYLLAATLLTGVLQILAGVFKLGSLMKFVSRSVVTGFVNALAILIFMAQLPEFVGQGPLMYVLVGLGLVIIYGLPRFIKVIPSPLVCIVTLTGFSMVFGWGGGGGLLGLLTHPDGAPSWLPAFMNSEGFLNFLATVSSWGVSEASALRTVGSMGELPSTLPVFLLPDIPLNWETLMIILPYSIPLAVVGILESLMTATIVDDLTDTPSNKSRECVGQGVANVTVGFFGGMAACAMIGQSIINIKSGGRGRLSSLAAGVILLILCVVLGPWVAQIPMAALVAVMIMVAIGTFSWSSFTNLRLHHRTSSVVMIATVLATVFTHNLAVGVGVGVLLSALFFAFKVSQLLDLSSTLDAPEERTYRVRGQLFFVSAGTFSDAFDFREILKKVRIDVSEAHFWDLSAIHALDRVVLKFRREGAEVEIIGLNEASKTLVLRLARHDKAGAADEASGH